MRAETFYIAVPEGELPLYGTDYDLEDDIESAMSNGEDLVKDSCSGMPQAQIYEVTLKLVKESSVTVTWDDV